MTKRFIPLLLIITLSGCAHQLLDESAEPESTQINSEQTIIHKPKNSGIPATPKKRIAPKKDIGDAYNE